MRSFPITPITGVGFYHSLLAVRGRLRRATLRLANSRRQRKRRLPAEFEGFGQRNFIKRKIYSNIASLQCH
jgi:hypothetical protein